MNPDEKTTWDQRYRESPSSWVEPDSFLIRAYEEFLSKNLPGSALDLAGGAGRNAIWLVERGWRVKLIDISGVALQMAREKLAAFREQPAAPRTATIHSGDVATVHDGSLQTDVVDLNSVHDLGAEQYDLVLVFYFLRRELFPAIGRAIKPGGTLIYRTYTVDRIQVPGGPSDPRYLLEPNELLHAFAQMRVLHYHEMVEGKAAAELVARK